MTSKYLFIRFSKLLALSRGDNTFYFMRIAFLIDQYLPETSAPSRRVSGLAENLVSLGHEVEVICPLPDYEDGKRRKKWLTTFHRVEIINGVKIHRMFAVPFCNGGTIKRLLNHYSFRFSSKRAKLDNPDVIIASTPPLISCKSSVKIAKKYKAKLVLDVRDIWPEVAIEMGSFSNNSFKAKSFSKIAEYLYKNADLVTTVSNNKIKTLSNRLDKYSKEALLISNGVDDFFLNLPTDEAFLSEYGFDKYFSIIHVGKVGNAQDLDSFLELAKRTLGNGNFKFFLIGDGVQLPHILDRIEKEKITNVIYCGKRNIQECATAYRYSKLSYISLVNENLKDSVPTKLYETLFAGCPCLLSACGESADVVEESRFGYCSKPGDLQTLFANFDKAVNEYDSLMNSKEYCFNYIYDNFNRKNVAKILESELQKLICH